MIGPGGGYYVTSDDPLPLLPSGPGGIRGIQLHSPPNLIIRVDRNGESGIRTHGGVTPTHAFQACSLNHSDISPMVDRQPTDCTTGFLMPNDHDPRQFAALQDPFEVAHQLLIVDLAEAFGVLFQLV